MDARARVATNVRRLRVEAGLSQEAFAVDAGIDRTYVSRVERRLENPSLAVLERIAKALKVDVVEILAQPASRARPGTLKPGRKPGGR